MPRNKRILFAIMGWGMGHATRCVPIIKSLMKNNYVILSKNEISTIAINRRFDLTLHIPARI